MAQTVKNLPAVQETWVQSLGQENALEEEMATHSRILDEKSYGQRSLADYSLWGCKELDITERLTLSLHFQSMVFCSSSLNGVKELIGLITRFFH